MTSMTHMLLCTAKLTCFDHRSTAKVTRCTVPLLNFSPRDITASYTPILYSVEFLSSLIANAVGTDGHLISV